MVLKGLFEREGLEQDTGLLKERWGQGGSNIVKTYDSYDHSDGAVVQHTITTGKKLYIKEVHFAVDEAFDVLLTIRENSGSPATIVTFTTLAIGNYVYTYDVPLVFDVDISLYNTSATGHVYATLIGWEE